MMSKLAKICALALLACAAAAQAQDEDRNYAVGEISVGDHVSVDGSLMNKWTSCTVTAIKPVYNNPALIDNLTVRCANGSTYQTMATPRAVRKGGAGAGAAPSAAAGAGGGAVRTYGDPALQNLRPARGPIPSGLYLCKAGNTRNMLTLGQMRVSGNRFTFTDPRGYRTAGSYSMGPKGYTWQGDIGRIANSQIVGSGLEPTGQSFWFMFTERPGSLAQSASCGRIG